MVVPAAMPVATTTGPAAPAGGVSVENGAATKPTQVSSAMSIFKVLSFAAAVLAVNTTFVPGPETVKYALTSVSAPKSARILVATSASPSLSANATLTVLGEPNIPAA